MAAGSHEEKGICALLVIAAKAIADRRRYDEGDGLERVINQ